MKKKTETIVLLCCAALALLAAAAVLLRLNAPRKSEPRTITLCFFDGSERTVSEDSEELFPLSEIAPDGYRFIGWTDGEGRPFDASEGSVPEKLYQNCIVILGDELCHRAYIFPDEDGIITPDRPFTRADMARMFGALLHEAQCDDISFTDVAENEACLHGAQLMRRYGLISGDTLRPDEILTVGELCRCLAPCFEEGLFDGITAQDEPLSVVGAVDTVNRALGRNAQAIPADVTVWMTLMGVDQNYSAQIAEASIDHSRDDSGQWTDYRIPAKLEPGLIFLGNDLYCVDEQGSIAVGREVNGLLFGDDGRYTSGSEALDEYVLAVLAETVTEDMTKEEKLKAVFDYTVKNVRYRKGDMYDKNTEDWWQECALKTFEKGGGNCFNFSAVFCALARAVGYDMRVCSGSTFGSGVHAWAYTFIDGEERLFDPQSQMKGKAGDMFDIKPAKWKAFQYDPVHSD